MVSDYDNHSDNDKCFIKVTKLISPGTRTLRIKGPPSIERLFDRLFLLWKFALLIVAILDESQLWLGFHI